MRPSNPTTTCFDCFIELWWSLTSHLSHPAPVASGMKRNAHRGVGCRCLVERSRYAAARTGLLRLRISHAGGLVLHWPLTEASTGCWRSTWAMMPTPPAPCAASSPGRSTSETRIALGHCPCKEGLPVTNLEAGCENKCASPYIGERLGENSVGGKWLMGAVLRIALTLTGRGQGAVWG
jgi:hypothetical protein